MHVYIYINCVNVINNYLFHIVLLRNSSLTCITWQPSNTEVVVIGSTDGDIIKVDIRQPKEALQTVPGFSRPVHRIKFSPDR